MAWLRNELTWVWLLLLSSTLLSWWWGTGDKHALFDGVSSELIVALGIVLIAVVKCRFVIWHFMEARHGPMWLRLACDAWLVSLAAIVIGLYRYSA